MVFPFYFVTYFIEQLFTVVAEYKLRSSAQNFFQRVSTMLQAYAGFWNTQSEEPEQSGRDGLMRAMVVIDPITQQHVNFTMKSPSQIVRIQSVELPIKVYFLQIDLPYFEIQLGIYWNLIFVYRSVSSRWSAQLTSRRTPSRSYFPA